MKFHIFHTSSWLAAGLLAACCLGCADRSYDRYVPSADASRQALDTALHAWQDGRSPGKLEGTPPIQVVDSKWQAGQKLRGYEILSEEAGEGGKKFSVRLTLKSAPAEQVVRYVVIGREPIWIYREEDYKQPKGM